MQSNKTDMASNVDLVKHKSKSKKGLKPADRKPAKMIKDCKYCGGSHLQAKCPAYGKKCNICFKNNHFAKVCKERKTVKAVNINESSSTSDSDSENEWFVGSIEIKYENKDTVGNDEHETNITDLDSVDIETIDPINAQINKTVCFDEIKSTDSDSDEVENPVSDSDEIENTALRTIKSEVSDSLPDLIDESEEEEYFINAVDNDQIHDWNMVLQTDDSQVEYKLDTGSQVNIITKRTFQNLGRKGKIHSTNAKLTAYDGGNIEVLGKCILRVGKLNRKTYPVEFFIVGTHSPSIIGLKTCERLDLIKIVYLVNDVDPNLSEEFADTFGNIGCLPGEYKIKVDLSVDPLIEPPRRIPFSL